MTSGRLGAENQEELFKIKLADFLIEWNHLEKLTSFLLFKLAGGDARVEVLTARLQSSSLINAIVPLSQVHPNPFREHVQTFAKRFDRLRAWRNFYVHGIFILAFDTNGEGGAIIQDAGIKGGKLMVTDVLVRHSEIEETLERVRALRRYLDSFIGELWEGFPFPVEWEKVVPPSPAPDLPKAYGSPFLSLRDD